MTTMLKALTKSLMGVCLFVWFFGLRIVQKNAVVNWPYSHIAMTILTPISFLFFDEAVILDTYWCDVIFKRKKSLLKLNKMVAIMILSIRTFFQVQNIIYLTVEFKLLVHRWNLGFLCLHGIGSQVFWFLQCPELKRVRSCFLVISSTQNQSFVPQSCADFSLPGCSVPKLISGSKKPLRGC